MKFWIQRATVFGLVVVGFGGSLSVGAQSVINIEADSIDLPAAVVIGNRVQVPLQSVGHTFDVLTRSDLAALPISSVVEALQFVPGLDLRQRGPRGVQADLSIRGGTFDQVLVLINGIRMADPQTGHHVLNIPVPLENVERIEVLKGPGARLYGQNAFAGAINIITRHPTEEGLTVRATGGDFGFAGFGVSGTLLRKGITHTLSYGRDLAAGYRENTDFDVANLFYQATLPTDGGEFELLAALSDRDFGANGFYASATATQQAEAIQTSILALSHKLNGKRYRLTQRLAWRRNQDEYVFVRSNPSLYRNLHLSHTYGYDGYLSREGALGMTGVGVELQGVALASNLLGQRERLVANVLLEQAFSLADGRLTVTPGLTFNYLSDAGARTLPALDLLYKASDELKVYANAGLTYRVPTYTDLFYEDPANVGNPDLVPERAYAFELGAQYDLRSWQVKGALWQRTGTNLIDYQRDTVEGSRWQPTNLNEVTFRGFEASVSARRVATWLPLVSAGYTYIDGRVGTDFSEVQSRYALEQLRHQFVARAVVSLGDKLSVSGGLRYADRVNDPLPSPEPGVDLPTRDYTVVDLRIDYRRTAWNVFAEASNVNDAFYTQANGVPLPGRWARAGLEVRL